MGTYGTREGILLRPRAQDDADARFGTVSQALPTLSQWLPWAKPGYAEADSAGWIAHCQRAWAAGIEHHFGIFETSSGRLLGGVGLSHVSQVRRAANLGYWVADDVRGGGVAVAAAHLAATWAFAQLHLQRIEVLVQPENRASLRVALKLGAVCEGIARNGIIVGGEPQEAIVHSLIPADFQNSIDS